MARPAEAIETAIRYRFSAPTSPRELAEIFETSGLRCPLDDPRRIRKKGDHANFTVTAWEDKKIGGVVRALTDFAFCCYVSDLGVCAKYPRKGSGKRLLRLFHRKRGEEVMVLLLSAPGAIEYYPKVGFEKAENVWKIHRAR